MNEESNRIHVGGNVSGNIIGGSPKNSKISYESQSTASPEPTQAKIEDSLSQLRAAIKTDLNLNQEQKETALTQVKILEEAVKNPNDEEKKKQAQTATFTLEGMIKRLSGAANFVEECNKLLPFISKLVGLG